jgi:hypothetical protein
MGTGIGANFYIEGMPEFLRSLGVTPGRVKAAQKAFLQLAATRVMVWAKEGARDEGGVAAKSASNIKTGRLGEVKYGGKPYNMGAEFGSYQYRQFETWRGKGDDAGYFLWPAVRRFRDTEMMDLWVRESWDALSEAFTQR